MHRTAIVFQRGHGNAIVVRGCLDQGYAVDASRCIMYALTPIGKGRLRVGNWSSVSVVQTCPVGSTAVRTCSRRHWREFCDSADALHRAPTSVRSCQIRPAHRLDLIRPRCLATAEPCSPCAPAAAGRCPWAPRRSPTASTSPCSAATARPSASSSTPWTATRSLAEIALHPHTQPHRRSLAHPRRAACRRRSATAGAWTDRAGGGNRFDPAHRPARPRRHRPLRRRRLGRGRPITAARPTAARHAPQPVLPPALRLARGRAAADAAGRLHHLRAARPRLHLPSLVAASPTPAPSPAWSRRSPTCKQLGVTAVELLPVHEFDEDDCPFTNPLTGERLRNFWGYNSIAFAAPKAAYAASGPEHGQVTEFRDMVRAFHAAGIEVILDVVFNHTGEGDDRGRTYSFRGLDNELYYMLGAGRQLSQLLRLRQHGQLQPSGRPRPDPDLPALLGGRHARGRPAFRSGLGAWAATSTATCWSSRRSSR